jgi:hypothetical protein
VDKKRGAIFRLPGSIPVARLLANRQKDRFRDKFETKVYRWELVQTRRRNENFPPHPPLGESERGGRSHFIKRFLGAGKGELGGLNAPETPFYWRGGWTGGAAGFRANFERFGEKERKEKMNIERGRRRTKLDAIFEKGRRRTRLGATILFAGTIVCVIGASGGGYYLGGLGALAMIVGLVIAIIGRLGS